LEAGAIGTLRAAVGNCLVWGELPTQRPASRSGGSIQLTVSGHPVRIEQKHTIHAVPLDDLKDRFTHTTDVFVDGVTYREGKSIVNDLCVLLSFATMSPVRPFEYHLGSQSSASP
jgi:hypothetical protein